MIFNVIWTYALFRGAAVATGNLPYGWGAFFSHGIGAALEPLGHTANEIIETVALLLHIGVMLVFLLIVLHSKHLHIGLAPVNVTFKRLPNALGPLLPMEYNGEYVDFEDPAEDVVLGRGKIEDFTWKGYLDFTTCTECGRCQSQCPAWNTGKPLSPKLVIMNLRDHLFAKAPYILGDQETPLENTAEGGVGEDLRGEKHAETPCASPSPASSASSAPVPNRPPARSSARSKQGGVIDPDVLWSCTTCGACVEQCPVDIEHIDHIVDMRRYQVMVESEFPGELGVLFKNLERTGNPWGQSSKERTKWIDEVDFDVPVYGEDVDSFDGFEYLFWVGCAGALRTARRRPPRPSPNCSRPRASSSSSWAPARPAPATRPAARATSSCSSSWPRRTSRPSTSCSRASRPSTARSSSPARTASTRIGREYPQLGGNYTVVHHTQLLNRLVRDKKLVPVSPVSQDVTYHDPCYLGRHNKEYAAPRELIGASGAKLTEMPRHADRGLCCGAGGARMWMEEHIGKRVNHERVEEALDTDASKIATGCPFCRVMMTDGVGDDGRGDGQGGRGPRRRPAAARGDRQGRGHAARQGCRGRIRRRPCGRAGEDRGQPRSTPLPPRPSRSTEDEAEPAAKAETAATSDTTETAAAPAAPAKGGSASPRGHGAPARSPPRQQRPPPKPPRRHRQSPPRPTPVKGLGIAAGARRPGKKPAAPAEATAEAITEAPAEPAKAEPPVKGLGIAAGARRPGKKAPPPRRRWCSRPTSTPTRPRPARNRPSRRIRISASSRARQARTAGEGSRHRAREPDGPARSRSETR